MVRRVRRWHHTPHASRILAIYEFPEPHFQTTDYIGAHAVTRPNRRAQHLSGSLLFLDTHRLTHATQFYYAAQHFIERVIFICVVSQRLVCHFFKICFYTRLQS